MKGSGAARTTVRTPAAGTMTRRQGELVGLKEELLLDDRQRATTEARRGARPRSGPSRRNPQGSRHPHESAHAAPCPDPAPPTSPATIGGRRIRSSKSASIFSIDSRRVFVSAARDLRSEFSARMAVTSLFLRIQTAPTARRRHAEDDSQVKDPSSPREAATRRRTAGTRSGVRQEDDRLLSFRHLFLSHKHTHSLTPGRPSIERDNLMPAERGVNKESRMSFNSLTKGRLGRIGRLGNGSITKGLGHVCGLDHRRFLEVRDCSGNAQNALETPRRKCEAVDGPRQESARLGRRLQDGPREPARHGRVHEPRVAGSGRLSPPRLLHARPDGGRRSRRLRPCRGPTRRAPAPRRAGRSGRGAARRSSCDSARRRAASTCRHAAGRRGSRRGTGSSRRRGGSGPETSRAPATRATETTPSSRGSRSASSASLRNSGSSSRKRTPKCAAKAPRGAGRRRRPREPPPTRRGAGSGTGARREARCPREDGPRRSRCASRRDFPRARAAGGFRAGASRASSCPSRAGRKTGRCGRPRPRSRGRAWRPPGPGRPRGPARDRGRPRGRPRVRRAAGSPGRGGGRSPPRGEARRTRGGTARPPLPPRSPRARAGPAPPGATLRRRENTGHGPELAVEGQLADERHASESLGGQVAVGRENRDGDGEIQRRARFRKVGGREVHDDVLRGRREADVPESRADALAALLHGRIREAHDRERREACGRRGLHDDRAALEAVHRRRVRAGDGHARLQFTVASESTSVWPAWSARGDRMRFWRRISSTLTP